MSNDYNGKKRSELPDSVFGIPQERKYPMPDEKHTRSAIKLFNHVEPKYEKQLAKAVIKNMKKYNIDGSVVGPNNRLRKYLPKDMIKESYVTELSSNIDKDHKQKGDMRLSKLKRVRITESIINKYKSKYPMLKHVRCKDTNTYICDGYMWFDGDSLAAHVGSCEYLDDHTKWIVSLEILADYRGYGLSKQILDFAVKNMNCKYLSVSKTNHLAKKIYDNYGFKVYHEDKSMYYMTIDRSVKESSDMEYKDIYSPQNTGIYYLIFDIGDVLVTTHFKRCLKNDPDIPDDQIDTIKKLWFLDKDDIDDTMDLDTYRDIVNKRMGPEYSKYIPNLFKHNIDCVNVLDYTVPVLEDLHNKGYKLYYLSNWSMWTHDLLAEKGVFDFLKLMDGGIFSYDAHCMKPDLKIYTMLLNQYKINPEEAMFFDDKERNIEAANKLGIHGVLFDKHDSAIIYNALDDMYRKNVLSEFTLPFGGKINMNKLAKELIEDIKPVIFTSKNKQQASKLGLTLKCELETIDRNTICIVVLDGPQDKRDTKEARLLLSNIQIDCKSKLYGYVSKVTIGDSDEGCLYLTVNKKYIQKARKDLLESAVSSIPESFIINENNEDPMYFYHLVNKNVNMSKGLLSLGYMYNHDRNMFRKNSAKYRERLCEGWGIYTGRDPDSLTDEEVFDGLKRFRGVDNLNSIYFFKFPPYESLDKEFKRIYKSKEIYRININDPKTKSLIKNIDYGFVDSCTDNDRLNRNWYDNVSIDDYFSNFDKSKGLLFSTLYHISIEFKKGICPAYCLEKVKTPNTIDDIRQLESSIQEYDYIPESGVLSVIKPIPTKDKNKIKYIMEDLGDDFKDFVFANICFYDIEEYEKTPIGFVILRKKPELHTAFVSIGVSEQHRNSGVGSKLLQKAISYFKSTKDLMWLEYWVNIDNKASIALAEKSGFVKYLSDDTAKALGYYHYHMKNNNNLYEASISEYGTTGGTIVGSNQPDSVYIVNYMQNNAFSGHKEPKFGVCRKGMKDLHIVGGKYNRFHYVSDLDKFKEEASDIHVYRYKGKPKNEFFDIIEEMKDDNDLDLYKLITGREIKDRSEIQFDGDFIEEECFFDTIDAIKACTEAGLLEASTDLHPIPILTETVQGRPYNYYRDLNGVFIQHEITGLRSKSYETLNDIPEAEKDIVKRGYLV